MFTGIIEEVGKINSIVKNNSSLKLNINCNKILENSKIGDSIAVNGVCLTITALNDNSFFADVSYETIKRTSFKNIVSGSSVNLERALTLSTFLGGHIVQGHIDNIGIIASITKKGDSYILKINYPKEIDKYIVEKGSITLDGISLTVADIKGYSLEVAVINHTYNNTTLCLKKSGDIINIEIDLIARYLEKLLKNNDKEDKILLMVKAMQGDLIR